MPNYAGLVEWSISFIVWLKKREGAWKVFLPLDPASKDGQNCLEGPLSRLSFHKRPIFGMAASCECGIPRKRCSFLYYCCDFEGVSMEKSNAMWCGFFSAPEIQSLRVSPRLFRCFFQDGNWLSFWSETLYFFFFWCASATAQMVIVLKNHFLLARVLYFHVIFLMG